MDTKCTFSESNHNTRNIWMKRGNVTTPKELEASTSCSGENILEIKGKLGWVNSQLLKTHIPLCWNISGSGGSVKKGNKGMEEGI